MGKEENADGKVLPFTLDEIDAFKEKCDYLVVEGDGSRMKPLKGWNTNEPVFVKRTDKTIGVLSIKSLGMKINEENIHRMEKFLKISGGKTGGKVSKEQLTAIIEAPMGLFKDSCGEKILLINQADTREDIENALILLKLLEKKGIALDKIIIASLKKRKYYIPEKNA